MFHRLHAAVTAATAGIALLLAFAPALPARNGDITIRYPSDGATVVPELDADGASVVILEATFTVAGEAAYFVPTLDGLYAGCEDYAGDGPHMGNDCFAYVEGQTWRFRLMPAGFEHLGLDYSGEHTFELAFAAWVPDTQTLVALPGGDSVTFTIGETADPVEPSATALPPGEAGPPGAELPQPQASASRLQSGSPAAPSVLSATTTAQDLALTPERALLTTLITIILLLIVGFPGTLLGSTLARNHDRIFGRLDQRVQRWRANWKGAVRAARTPSWLVIAAGMAIATIITGFIDPGFGLNPGSLRMLVSVAIAFVLQSLLGWWLIKRLLRRSDPGLKPRVRFRFGSLIVLALAVLVSRLVGFEPGMVFGLIVGLTYGAALAATQKARVSLIGSGYAFTLAILGWVGYSIVEATGGAEPGFWLTFLSETLSGLAVSGIASLPLALLPIAFLDGGTLFSWKKWVWATAYGVGLFAFLVILMPLPFSWGEITTPFATWVALYAAYAAVALGVWAWFRLVKPRRLVLTGAGSSTAARKARPS